MITRSFVRTCILTSIALLVGAASAHAQRAVIVVRHAERQDDSTDSPLSAAGKARAEHLAAMLRDAGVTTLYATQWQRTQQTLGPLAASLGLKVEVVPGAEIDQLVAAVKKAPATGVVVIAAHSDTAPKILNVLGATNTISIAPAEYDNLFVVVPVAGGAPSLVRLRY